jgi:hypothetical protein
MPNFEPVPVRYELVKFYFEIGFAFKTEISGFGAESKAPKLPDPWI